MEAVGAADGRVSVDLSGGDDDLVLRIDGAHEGVDVQGVTDRVEAVGGVLHASDGLLVLTIPVAEAAELASALAGGPSGAVPGG